MIIIDVRTPDEFTAGHVEGAKLIDYNAGDFAAALHQLDPAEEYLLYCRSGHRSEHAAALMAQAGFSSATNLGSVENAAAATGRPIVESVP